MIPQHPAAPETETDANGLREALSAATAVRRSLPGELHGGPEANYTEVFIEEAFAHHAPGPTRDPDLRKIWRADAVLIAEAMRALPSLLADLDAARERVRVVEGERDAARAEVDALMQQQPFRVAESNRLRAESAEAAHEAEKAAHAETERLRALWFGENSKAQADLARLRAGVEALADEWEADQGRTWIASLADDLRVVLAGGGAR